MEFLGWHVVNFHEVFEVCVGLLLSSVFFLLLLSHVSKVLLFVIRKVLLVVAANQ